MMKNIYLLILILSSALYSQQTKLGKVTIEELAERVHPMDTSASAALLSKKEFVHFIISSEGYWQVVTETEVKIKIYKKEGYEYANVVKPFYIGSRGEVVRFTDAATYNLVDGKVEKTKVRSDGEFTVPFNKYVSDKKLSFPNVKEGSILEYKCEVVSFNFSSLDVFYFEDVIPVNYAEYKLHIPACFSYNVVAGGYVTPKIKNELGNSTYADRENWSTYTLSNLKGLHDEKFVNNINNYRSRIKYELSSWKQQSGAIEEYATNWNAVAKKIYEDDDFGRELKKDNYFEKEIDLLIKDVRSSAKMVDVIYDYVKSNMNWNEYLGFSCQKGVATAYKEKSGNVADINLMLTAMLRHAGLKANPVLVSTRNNGIAIFPSRAAYNYVVAAVELDGKIILLDATSKNALPNMMPTRTLNWNGRMIREDGTSTEIDLMCKTLSKDNYNVIAAINGNGVITGKIRNQLTDYEGYFFRETYGSLSEESYLLKLEKDLKNCEIDTYEVLNVKDLTKPISQTFNFSNSDLVDVIGDSMYFSPLLFLAEAENPFKDENRAFPVDFLFPRQQRYTFTITIPDGYAVQSLPQASSFVLPDNMAVFKFLITSTANNVQVIVNFELNRAIVQADYYDALKTLYKELVTKENEKVVIKKVI